jgi:hypothetical protein
MIGSSSEYSAAGSSIAGGSLAGNDSLSASSRSLQVLLLLLHGLRRQREASYNFIDSSSAVALSCKQASV